MINPQTFFKFAGIILICSSSTFLGIYHVMKIKFHMNELNQLINALDILKSEIEFGITPINEACKNICARSHSFIKELFLQMSNMFNKKNLRASQIWIVSTENILKKTYLDNEDIESVKSFSDMISSLDSQLQTKSLETINKRLQKKISILENQYQNEKKLYYNLGFLMGLLVTTIFI